MTELTRRRSSDRADCWHVFYGDVRVGLIGIRAGVPRDVDQWGWSCGFYPGSEPGEHLSGSAPSFEQARIDFEAAWKVFSAKRTDADYAAWRADRDWHIEKRAMQAAGELLPSQRPNSMMRCPCGETFDSHAPDRSYVHRQHIYAAQAADGIRR